LWRGHSQATHKRRPAPTTTPTPPTTTPTHSESSKHQRNAFGSSTRLAFLERQCRSSSLLARSLVFHGLQFSDGLLTLAFNEPMNG
jgi:hypothetical protein